MNLVRIAEACAVECVRQKVGMRELGYLLEAYDWLITQRDIDHFKINVDVILTLGSFVEPGKNRYGFRKTAVTFQNGGGSANASEIPRLMINLRDAIHRFVTEEYFSHNLTAAELTKEFLWIHPFADGNGRVGFLLWNYLMGTLDEPLALPDFGW